MKNRTKYIIIIILFVFLAVSSFILSGTNANTDQSEKLTTAPVKLTDFDKSILGTRLDTSSLKAQHIHADFAVFINDQQLNFNNPKYFLKSAFMHVERDDDGSDGKKLHMHSTNVPLWVFFESLDMNFNRNCITLDNGESFCGTDKMKFYVNGRENSEYENYVFKNGDKILISFGSSNIQKELEAVTDFAAKETLEFQEICRSNGHEWMEMRPIINGKFLSDEPCLGCMAGENHYCDIEEYKKVL